MDLLTAILVPIIIAVVVIGAMKVYSYEINNLLRRIERY